METLQKITHLIPNTQFGQTLKEYSEGDYRRIRDNFDGFVDQPLELYQFVPCEQVKSVWVPMEKPNTYHDFEDRYKSVDKDSYVEQWYSECKRYQAAKERCLFEGFGVVQGGNSYTGCIRNESEDIRLYFLKETSEMMFSINDNTIKTIEGVTREKLPLTPTALKTSTKSALSFSSMNIQPES